MNEPVIDLTLLRQLEEVFRKEGYRVSLLSSVADAISMVLAENNYFMVAATAVARIEDLAAAEPFLLASLRSAAVGEAAGPKRWDAYLVLLTQQEQLTKPLSDQLFEMTYDTSIARRIVRVGVRPDLDSVRRAVVPFVAPPQLISGELSADPLGQLGERLISLGEPSDLIGRALDAYRSGGRLSDVL